MNRIAWEHRRTAVDAHRDQRGHPAFWSACAVVFAAVVAVHVYWQLEGGFFCTTERTHGANVESALGLVFWGGIAAALLIPFVRNAPRLLGTVLLLAAVTLAAAMVLLAVDSATYVGVNSCGFWDTTDTPVNESLYYLFVLWGAPFAVLGSFAVRLLLPSRESARPRRRLVRRAGVTILAVGAVAAAVALSHLRPALVAIAASAEPHVFVCKNAIRAPEALGGPWVCPTDVDIGTAPIRPPQSLMCTTELSGVAHKPIGVQVLYGTRVIEHGTLYTSDATASPYAEFDRSYIRAVGNGDRLPPGVYKCRFLVGGKLAVSRRITVGAFVRTSRTRSPRNT